MNKLLYGRDSWSRGCEFESSKKDCMILFSFINRKTFSTVGVVKTSSKTLNYRFGYSNLMLQIVAKQLSK